MNILRQSVGVDISMDSFEARLGLLDDTLTENITEAESFKNNPSGFKKLLKWVKKQKHISSLPIVFTMEATGVYYEKLANFLYKQNLQVAVVLPNKIKNFGKSLGTKSKTDPIDAKTITIFALRSVPKLWQPPEPFIASIKGLSREYHTLKGMITEIKNQLHAKNSAYQNDKSTIKRKRQLIKTLEKQTKEIINEINKLIHSKPEMEEKIRKVSTIKGIGEITVITILAETNIFEQVTSIKQLVSYAGLDVALNESGTKKGKTTISKKGNKFIRKALFMPAMSACRHNPQLKEFYKRLVSKGKNKKAVIIAVARKLLTLIFTIWKNDTEFIPNYDPINKAAFSK